MRSFILFFALLVALDLALGAGLGALYRRTLTGEAGGLTNWALQSEADIVILGSSRAKHHISSKILSETMQARALNFGINGQEFLYASTLFKLWTERHGPPRVVILHVDPGTLAESENEIERLGVFSFYADHPRVSELLFSAGPFERMKYLSSAYRFNGKVLPILKNLFSAPASSFDGFEGLNGELSKGVEQEAAMPRPAKFFAEKKVELLREMVDYCNRNDTRLFIVHSPAYDEDAEYTASWTAAMRDLLERYPGPRLIVIDAITHSDIFASKPELFRDIGHLNARGAELFSHILAAEIARDYPAGPSRRVPAAEDASLVK